MPRICLLLCSGVCLLNVTVTVAQNLPQKPTPQQVAGYQMQQQHQWQMKQLPKNSVLYKTGYTNMPYRSYDFSFKKEKQPYFSLPANPMSTVGIQPIKYSPMYKLPPSLQSDLLRERLQYSNWYKQSWWKDPMKATGSEILRGFLINNGKGLHL
ncbi:MAG TPA: hypothetical protein VIZ28_01760 [Chitinophagaceae bacterium]